MKIRMDVNRYKHRPGSMLHSTGGGFKHGSVATDHGVVSVWFDDAQMTPQFLLWFPPFNFCWQSRQRFKSWNQIKSWAFRFAAHCASDRSRMLEASHA